MPSGEYMQGNPAYGLKKAKAAAAKLNLDRQQLSPVKNTVVLASGS